MQKWWKNISLAGAPNQATTVHVNAVFCIVRRTHQSEYALNKTKASSHQGLFTANQDKPWVGCEQS